MPNVNAFELVELSPTLHTKSITVNASLIIDGHDQVVLNNFASSQRCDLIIDGMRVMAIKPHDCISIRQIKSKFKLCLNHNLQEYITKLQKTFIKN
jgi:NAD kinase